MGLFETALKKGVDWMTRIIRAEVTKPLEDLKTEVSGLKSEVSDLKDENKKQTARLASLEEQNRLLDADMADSLGSQLIREHDYYLRQGWCPTSDKQRLDGVYTRYKARNRNHIAETYMSDIIALPTQPNKRSERE